MILFPRACPYRGLYAALRHFKMTDYDESPAALLRGAKPMTFRLATSAVLLLLTSNGSTDADVPKTVSGRIVDDSGHSALASTSRRSGGERAAQDQIDELPWEQSWKDVGRLGGRGFAMTDADGKFSIDIHPGETAPIAFDEGRIRTRGRGEPDRVLWCLPAVTSRERSREQARPGEVCHGNQSHATHTR